MLLSLDWLDPTDLVALGEATLSKEAASSVSDDFAWFIVVFRSKRLHFLLNDLIVSQIKSVKTRDSGCLE